MANISLLDRFKSAYQLASIGFRQPALVDNTQKGIFGGSITSPLFGYGAGLDNSNRDFTYSEYGATQASQMLVDINASLNVWEQWLDGLTWHVKDINTGKTLVSSDERIIDSNERGARFLSMVDAYRRRFHHSFWKSIVISDWVTGETYIRFVVNRADYIGGLQWLNPLATEPMIVGGKVQYYTYSNDDSQDVGYRLYPQEIAYRMLRRNLYDDLRGYSPVLSIIDESNLSRNVKRAFRQYFRNGMILGGIISPEGDGTFSPTEIGKVEDMLIRNHRGVHNSHGWIISPKKFFAEQFASKDASKDIEVLPQLSKSIHKALGVPEELSGTVTDATYENLEASEYSFYRLRGIPYAKDIARYLNTQILPRVEGKDVYIEPELSKYEVERPEVVSQDVTASVISLYNAQVKRGQTEADERLKDIYIVNGRPMHADVIAKLASTMPSDEIEQRANAEESMANAEAKPAEVQAQIVEASQPEPDVERLALPEPDSEKSVTISHGDHDHTIPVQSAHAYSHDNALAELKAWKKFRKNDPSRDFEPEYTLGDVADGIQAKIAENADLDTVFDEAFDMVRNWQKAIQSVRIDFEDSVQDIMDKALADNNYGRRQWSTAMRAIIRRACTRAFADGLISGGILDGELSEEDENTLAEHIAEQSQYVTNLGEKIFKTQEGISQAIADQKPVMWFNKSVLPMFDAGQLSANGNRMMEFTGEDGEKSCNTCPRLKGQRHRHKTWARKALRPGIDTDNFECGGFNCKHRLTPVNAKARGNF